VLSREARTSLPRSTTQQNRYEVIRLVIDSRVKHCGGEMRLGPPNHPGEVRSHPSSSLLKALARGRPWYEWIVAGEVSGKRAIAQRLGLNQRYVDRGLGRAFLAPDIVGSILDGNQLADLTFAKLTRGLPTSWTEQRKQLGFPSAPASRQKKVQLALRKTIPAREDQAIESPDLS
jgi:hypothetical protein